MKTSADRTKVVVRHLPPAITPAEFAEQIDSRFGGRYGWLSFHPGKTSQKHQSYARAYIDFTKPEDVVDFAEFFSGHVFVNEKGSQFKAVVEYAPCQRLPEQRSKKDGREGSIVKDPDYLEFLEAIAKPVENLPSAEVQMDRKEAERAGAAKDVPIITPLMDFIRQKRAAKNGSRRILSNGKPIRKVAGVYESPSSASLRRGSEKRRVSTAMYVLRDSAKSTIGKDKSTCSLVPKGDDQLDKSVSSTTASVIEASEGRSGTPGSIDTGKKILLLKGKEKEIPLVSGDMSLLQNETSKSTVGSSTFRQNQRRETSGRIIKSILLNKDSRQSQSLSAAHSEQQTEPANLERDRRPPRPQNLKSFVKDNGLKEEKFYGNDMHGFPRDKQERRTRNRGRPDRGVWTPRRRSDGSHASDESLSSFNSQGQHKHIGRKGMALDGKELDDSFMMNEGKSLRRGGSSYSSYEKGVWIQKSSAAS